MEMIISDDEIKEIKIEDLLRSEDRGLVIIKGEHIGERDKGEENIVKELVAMDAMEIGASRAAEIHGVPQSSASKYKDGKDIADDETRERVLDKRHNIADLAITKLMDTLGLFDPNMIEKQTDIVKAASSLANVVDRVSNKNNGTNGGIHLHLYAPKQRLLETYEVIEVS